MGGDEGVELIKPSFPQAEGPVCIIAIRYCDEYHKHLVENSS